MVMFFRMTHLMMKSGRIIRLVMLELGPKVIKAEDGAQDRGSGGKEDLAACGSTAAVRESPSVTEPVVLSVLSGTPGSLRPSQGFPRSKLVLSFPLSFSHRCTVKFSRCHVICDDVIRCLCILVL